MCENLVRNGWAFQSYHLNFPWGQKPPISGVTCDLWSPFRTWPSYSSQKSWVKIWFGLVKPFKSYRVHKHFPGEQKSPWGGLKLTCDAHFRTRACYSSQKSCVKIWFGLAEIRGMLSLMGAEDPLFGGFTCDLWCPFSNSDVLFQSKVMCENLVWIVWNRRCAFSRGAETPY